MSSYIKIEVNGNRIYCSDNHKLLVVRDKNVITIEAKNLKYTDYLLLKDK